MATATVPQVVPFRQPTESITQTELSLLLSLKARARELESQIQENEELLKTRFASGAEVESGLLRAFLKTIERRSVAWKAVVERELGEDYARRVLAATRPDTFTHLIVTA